MRIFGKKRFDPVDKTGKRDTMDVDAKQGSRRAENYAQAYKPFNLIRIMPA